MNHNSETIQKMIEGGEHLYTMLTELCEGIENLPGCKMTTSLKALADDVSVLGLGVYETMRGFASGTDASCAECSDAEYSHKYEDPEADIPSGSDLSEFLDGVASLLASGKPVSISADIYLNSADPENSEDA